MSASEYDESPNSAASLRKEKRNPSCGGEYHRGETHRIPSQEMNKDLPWVVCGDKGLKCHHSSPFHLQKFRQALEKNSL